MPDVGYAFKPPKEEDVKSWEEARVRLMSSREYAIRNSSVVNLQSRESRKKFVEEYDRNNARKERASRIGRSKVGK